MRGSINRSASKGDNEDNEDSWGEHDFDVGEEGGGTVVENRRGKNDNKEIKGGGGEKRGGGICRCRKCKR